MFKLCKGCDKKKPKSEYHMCRTNTDGVHTRCKVCRSKSFKKYYTTKPMAKRNDIINGSNKCHKCDKCSDVLFEMDGKWEYCCFEHNGIDNLEIYFEYMKNTFKEKNAEWEAEQYYR